MSNNAENKALLRWVKVKTRGVAKTSVTGFNADSFGDGDVLLALLRGTRPDLASADDVAKLSTPQERIAYVLDTFEADGLPATIAAADVVDDFDSFSLMMYVAAVNKYCTAGGSGGDDVTAAGGGAAGGGGAHKKQTLCCRLCRKPAAGATVAFDEFVYHSACFQCSQCNKVLNADGRIIKLDGVPFCGACGKREWSGTIRQRREVKASEEKRRIVQHRVFVRFVNARLDSNEAIKNLSTELSDGIVLLKLLQSLFPNVPTPKYNKNPTSLVQKLDNLQVACEHLSACGLDDESRQVEPRTFTEGNVTLILGFMYRMWIRRLRLDGIDSLLEWAKQRVAPYGKFVVVRDFTPSFCDGKAFVALLHSEGGDGLFKLDAALENKSPKELLQFAFDTAEKAYAVPPTLNADDVLSGAADEKAIAAYVGEFAYMFGHPERQEEARRRAGALGQADDSAANDGDELGDEPPTVDAFAFEWEKLNISGWLKKQDPGGLRFYRRKFFFLQGSRLLYWSQRPSDSHVVGKMAPPEAFISLRFVQEVLPAKDANAFMLVTVDRTYKFIAPSAEDAKHWLDVLGDACALWKRQVSEQGSAQEERLSNVEGLGGEFIVQNENEATESYLEVLSLLGKLFNKKCYFVLKDGMLYGFVDKGEKQMARFSMYQTELRAHESDELAFTLQSGKKSMTLKADNEEQLHKWYNALIRSKLVAENFVNGLDIELGDAGEGDASLLEAAKGAAKSVADGVGGLFGKAKGGITGLMSKKDASKEGEEAKK